MVSLYEDIPTGNLTVAIHVKCVVVYLAGEDFASNALSCVLMHMVGVYSSPSTTAYEEMAVEAFFAKPQFFPLNFWIEKIW